MVQRRYAYMSYNIRKAGVIGSGTMGGGIATLLAGVGIPVVLLDIAAPETKRSDPPAKRNAVVLENVNKLKKSRVPAIFHPGDVERMTFGNVEDDLELLKDCDWIIEVIIEKLEPKQNLVAKLEGVVKAGAIVSSKTSGILVNSIGAGRRENFQRHFLGTHFFNPPRHFKLLVGIPCERSDPVRVVTIF